MYKVNGTKIISFYDNISPPNVSLRESKQMASTETIRTMDGRMLCSVSVHFVMLHLLCEILHCPEE